MLKDEIFLTPKQLERQTQGRDFAFPHILKELDAGRPVYYCDESIFSSQQGKQSVWACSGLQRPSVHRNKLSFEAVAAIAVINQRGELVLCETRQKSYNKESFIAFVERFVEVAERPCTLVLDNLSFHRADEVKETCKLNNVTLIYNGTYSSQFMPVEMVWNYAKRLWRQEVPKIDNFKNKTDLRRRIERCI